MNAFDTRQKSAERKFVIDEELAFKIKMRGNRLFGAWAAEKLGKSGEQAEVYAKEVAVADLEAPGDDDILARAAKDLAAAGQQFSGAQLEAELHRCRALAKEQLNPAPKA